MTERTQFRFIEHHGNVSYNVRTMSFQTDNEYWKVNGMRFTSEPSSEDVNIAYGMKMTLHKAIESARNDKCPKCEGSGVEADCTTEEGIDDCPYCRGGGLISLAVQARVRDFLTNPRYADPLYDFTVDLIYPSTLPAKPMSEDLITEIIKNNLYLGEFEIFRSLREAGVLYVEEK